MGRSILILLLALAGCDKSADKVAALEEQVGALDAKAKEAEALAEQNEMLHKRVTELEKRAASIETDATAAAEAHKADREKIDRLDASVEELRSGAANIIKETPPSKATPPSPELPEGDEGGGEKLELEKVGVAVCDEYLAAYAKCVVEKMPAAVREATLDAVAQSAKAFKQAAANPGMKATLETTCKSARDATAKAMKSFGCAM